MRNRNFAPRAIAMAHCRADSGRPPSFAACKCHAIFRPRGRRLGEGGWGVTRGKGPPWLLDPLSSTHNEPRLAACPLSGVPERIRAPCQLILRQVGKCAERLALRTISIA